MKTKTTINLINYVLILSITISSTVLGQQKGVLGQQKGVLVKIERCLYMFFNSIQIYTKLDNKWTPGLKYDGQPQTGDSQCYKDNDPALLDLTFEKTNTKLRIKLDIERNRRGFWGTTTGVAIITSANNKVDKYPLIVKDITSEQKFSYSCFKQKLFANTTDDRDEMYLEINGFQLQPFGSTDKRGIFVDSFDCQQWMTGPLWMGVITLIVFTSILLIGVHLLLRLNTPDRFENPKGKPLIIASNDE